MCFGELCLQDGPKPNKFSTHLDVLPFCAVLAFIHEQQYISMLDHFDIIASFYDRLIGPPDTSRLRRLLKLPAEGWLLDGGGGTGRVSNHLRPLVSGLVVSDLSHRMLAKAREKDIRPVQAHAEQLPFADGFFDRVLVVDALHHFCNQHESISDLLRVLKPGGRMVIEEPDFTHNGVKVLALIEKMLLMRSHFHTPEEIQRMFISHSVAAHIERDNRYTAWIIADKI
jgi:demethylmenaquinone methyltransferase/2-methoxy-6-polyprenyl-1,4-benzoquinol methylase